MSQKPTSLSRAPASFGRRCLGCALLVALPLLVMVLFSRPVSQGAGLRAAAGCPVFYQELGKRLSSLPRDAGRRAKVRVW